MEPQNFNQEPSQVDQTSPLHQVTSLSKYLAMALFVILPFVGGYIGYTFAPEKVVEVEKEVIREVEVEGVIEMPALENEIAKYVRSIFDEKTDVFRDDERGIVFEYPSDWLIFGKDLNPDRKIHSATYEFSKFGLGEDTIYIHEDALDPTAVIIRKYEFGLEDALEKWGGPSTTVDELQAENQIVYRITSPVSPNNQCETIRFIHSLSAEEIGEVRVSGVCPTHPEGYDELKMMVAQNVQFLNE